MATSSGFTPSPSDSAQSSRVISSSNRLRFPTPVAEARVSSWVRNASATVTMSSRGDAPSEERNMADSAYEFIDTDEESRDDNATESIASTDLGRPDDIASLADTERSGEESEAEEPLTTEQIPTFSNLDNPIECSFGTPTLGTSRSSALDDFEKPFLRNIEFEEPFSLGAETVSVKHTVSNFNEEQTAQLVNDMELQNPPKRLAVTIRQTMTKAGLSTKDPLRILYIGSHSAKDEIIHKIAGSVTASVQGGNGRQRLRQQSSSQLYNVVPVSAFGSERTPEIELMHSSGFQIKVENCTLAKTLKFENVPEKPDVIKLTLDDNFSYHSVPEGHGFIVEPHWELPQVAIFYCTVNDDIETRRTRAISRKFMSRHAIPSIIISHNQLFEKGHCMSLDHHSIHMCLESRDPSSRCNIIQRLPIDLASFLNIDARQMNRNLAYLTGLHEPSEMSAPVSIFKKVQKPRNSAPDLEKTSYSISDSVNLIRGRNGAELRAFIPVGLLVLSVLAAVLTGIPSYRFSSTPAISINSKTGCVVATTSSVSSLTTSSPILSLTSTPISALSQTSTRTVTVTHVPSPNSLSLLPSTELSQGVFKSNKADKLVCTAEIFGDREILIRIPSATKLSWLSKEAMSVNITRNNITVDTERAYSSDEGIILLVSKNEAYGVLNVSIVTTKKPRVNETFQVDFGTTTYQAWQTFWNKLQSLLPEDGLTLDSQTRAEFLATLEELKADVQSVVDQASTAGTFVAELAKSMSLEAVKRSAIISKEVGIQLAEAESLLSKQLKYLTKFQQPFNNGLLKAQVTSKLAWLKFQGKDTEYDEYKRRATAAIHSKEADPWKCKKSALKGKRAARKEMRTKQKTGRAHA